jgi:formate dehydrogenase subunit gamma
MQACPIEFLRAAVLALVAGLCLAGAPTQAAQDEAAVAAEAARAGLVQPGNNAPEFRDARRGADQSITFSAPADLTLIQSEGETWREARNGPLTVWGGWLLVVVFLAIAAFYAIRGRIKLQAEPSGRLVQRFSTVERMTHWTVAGTFVILALSGLTMLFGKHVLLPWMGHTVFSWLALLAKNGHNLVGPLFLAALLLMIVLFAKDNVWQAIDGLWIRKAGGLFSGKHVPSWRFNFGEKSWFWIGVVILGLTVGATGLVLDFPGYGQTRQDMQLAHLIHATAAILFMALSLGHIYLGSIGMEGALDSMRSGYVDETWAKEHHEYWYRQVKGEAIPPSYAPPHGGGTAQAAH